MSWLRTRTSKHYESINNSYFQNHEKSDKLHVTKSVVKCDAICNEIQGLQGLLQFFGKSYYLVFFPCITRYQTHDIMRELHTLNIHF